MTSAVLLEPDHRCHRRRVVPLVLHRLDRDPAQGSSVMLTFVTDSMGFFLFLALANAFLL